MIEHFCSAQRLRHLMRADCIPAQLNNLIAAFERSFNSDKRGTFLNDISAFCSAHNINSVSLDGIGKKYVKMNDEIVELLDQYNRDNGCDPTRPTRPYAIFLDSLDAGGVNYTTRKNSKSQGNSNIIIGTVPGIWYACSIKNIFVHAKDARTPDAAIAYFIVHKYEELTGDDVIYDHYRHFPIAGGRLFYMTFEKDVKLIKASDVLCHFALTPYRLGTVAPKQYIHVLPLDRVRVFLFTIH